MIQSLLDTEIKAKVFDGGRITPEEAKQLYFAPLTELGELADARRRQRKAAAYDGRGNEIVTYIIDRNINYTNVCNVYCKFCAFMRTERDDDSYVLSPEADRRKNQGTRVDRRHANPHAGRASSEARHRLLPRPAPVHPAASSHDQHPRLFAARVQPFRRSLRHVAGGSHHAASRKRASARSPAAAAKFSSTQMRNTIAPLKCDSDHWLEVMRIAHRLGLSSSATMMFGHVESVDDRIEHLRRLREVQDETGGFTAFICWTFQPENTRLKATPVGSHEYLRMQALSRIFLDNFDNVQSSWVTQGPKIGQVALQYGANDYGSVMMEENVVSAAGTSFRLTVDEISKAITELGYEARQRDNWYRLL